jgi:hypothetical protein
LDAIAPRRNPEATANSLNYSIDAIPESFEEMKH